jgi:signal transduction histidine kinase
MVIDRKMTDEEILRSYPAMLQRFELSYGMTKHDLQNHISALSSYLELCIRDENTEMRNRNIAKMSAIIQEMSKYVRNMGSVTTNSVGEEWRKLSDIIHSGISNLPVNGVVTNVSCGNVELRADPLLPMVFYNLAYNSIRHGKHVKNINISCEFEAGAMNVIYSDDGPGIDPVRRSKLFSPPSERERPHALFLIRQILFLLGITITERGEYGSGVLFEINIPESHFRMNTTPSQDIR